MSMSLTLPALMALRLQPGGPMSRAARAREGAIVLLGLFCAAVGASSAAASLMDKVAVASA